jgi:hypothetical protein
MEVAMEVLMEVPMEVDVAESPADLRNQSAASEAEGFGGRLASPAWLRCKDGLIYTKLTERGAFEKCLPRGEDK